MPELLLIPIRSKPGQYAAYLGNRELVRSRQPFFDAARVLLRDGFDPNSVLIAKHKGSSTVAMRSTAGEAARWTIEESDRRGLQKRRWKPHPHAASSEGVAA